MLKTIKAKKEYIAKNAPRHTLVWKRETTCAFGNKWHAWCKDCWIYAVLLDDMIHPIGGLIIAKDSPLFEPKLVTKCYGADARDERNALNAAKRTRLMKKYKTSGIDAVLDTVCK